MNESFEAVRRAIKKYHVEDNPAPPKLIVADKNFLDLESKKKPFSQFIIGVREYHEDESSVMEKLLNDLEIKIGKRPITFSYNDREIVATVIKDFEDYYDLSLGNEIFQRVGTSKGSGKLQYWLVIIVLENHFYKT